MSEIDDLTGKLKEYTEREDEHSLLPRVLLALLENGRRNEEKIANLADALSQAESKAAEHRTGLEGELKAMRSLVEQTGKETVDSIAESLSQAKSAAAEHRTELARELKATRSLIEQTGKETAASIAESQSQAESADAERHRVLIATLVKSESIAFQRHNESAKELKTAQADIGKLRRIVIWGGIILAVVIPAIIAAVDFFL